MDKKYVCGLTFSTLVGEEHHQGRGNQGRYFLNFPLKKGFVKLLTNLINNTLPTAVAYCLLLLLSLIPFSGTAQDYPVNVTTVLTPPYSLYLSDYTSPETNSLQVIINLRELDRPEYRVKLRVTIEGQGLTLRTKPAYTPAPIILQGGVPEIFTGADLSYYFNPNNLDFSGISKSDFIRKGSFPEGFYTFKIEVVDYVRNVVVSNAGLANAWIILNDPPLINLPFNNEKVLATDPQNVMFSWTPRHTGSPNAAFTTEYEFTLVELYPKGRIPNDAIRAANPIYVTKTSATSLNYSVMEPLLIPGRRYAFRIKAFDTDGRDLFKNNGYSEVYVFQFGEECLAPFQIESKALDTKRIKLSWEANETNTAINIRYKEKTKTDWQEENSLSKSLIIADLKPNTTYEYQVGGQCGTINSTYSEIASVTTPAEKEEEFSCGAPGPQIDIKTTPLNNDLRVDDLIKTADFEVSLEAVEKNSDGTYKGTGRAILPWLQFASVRVKFFNIRVNEEYRVYDGNITTIYTANSRFVLDADLSKDEGGDMGAGQGNDPDATNQDFDGIVIQHEGDIQSVTVDALTGNIVIVNEDGTTKTIPRVKDAAGNNEDAKIIDSRGDSWIVDKDGYVTEGPSTATPDAVTSASQVDFTVTFNPNAEQSYGFDSKKADNLGEYETVKIKDADYPIAWKSVETGHIDYVNAQATGKETFPAMVGFKTAVGPSPSQPGATPNEKKVTVSIPGNGQEAISAYVLVKEPGKEQTEVEVGRLNVKAYDKITHQLHIVPVNGAAVPATLLEEINKIYKQAVAEWTITIEDPYTVEPDKLTGLDDGESGMLASFPEKMRQFNREFKNKRNADNDIYYVFLINGTQSSSRSGFMPFKRKFGYIFTDRLERQPLATIIAHELGHGAFRLRHTFSTEAFMAAEKTTDNLMDYNGGAELKKYQWDFVHDPESMNGWLQDDEESAFGPYQYLAARYVIPGKLSSQIPVTGNAFTFFTSAGKILTLPTEVTDVTFNLNGSLGGFTITEDGKLVRYISTIYPSSEKFAGFRKELSVGESKFDNIYKDRLSKEIKDRRTQVVFGIFERNNGDPKCGINLYRGSYPVDVHDSWHSGGHELPHIEGDAVRAQLTGQEFIKKVATPDICDICHPGMMFLNRYSANITSKEEYDAVLGTAKLLCQMPDHPLLQIFGAENEKQFKEMLSAWMWPSERSALIQAREAFWERPDAWRLYYDGLLFFITNYHIFKAQIDDGAITNNTLKALVNAHAPEFLGLYSIEERIAIIKNLLPDREKIVSATGQVNWSELYVSNGEENAIINVLQSISTQSDAEKMLSSISSDGFLSNLNFHLDDFGFGGNNFTDLSKEFQRLTLLKYGINPAVQIELKHWLMVPEKNHFVYNDKRTFSFGIQAEVGGVYYKTIDFDASGGMTITYKVCNEVKDFTVYYYSGTYSPGSYHKVPQCIKSSETTVTPNYFDLISIDVISLNYLPVEANSQSGTSYLTYAGFLDYIQEKKGTEQVTKVIDYSVTAASLVFGVGEIALLIRSGATAARIALATLDVGSEIADMVINSDEFAKHICGVDADGHIIRNCSTLNNYKIANTLAQISLLGASGYDIATNWNSAKAAKHLPTSVVTSATQDVLALGDDVAKVTGWINKSDKYSDVIIHAKNGNTFSILIDGVEAELSATQLSYRLAGIDPSKTLRLLSCNDPDAAVELSRALGRDVVGSVGEMKLYDNGFIETGNWYTAKPDGTLDEFPDIPTRDPSLTPSAKSVVLGSSRKLSNNISHLLPDLRATLGAKFDDFIENIDKLPSTWSVNKTSNGAFSLVDSKGKKWADITSTEIRAIGGVGDGAGWNKLLDIDPPLIKDFKYVVDEKFIYQTDNLGRVNKITINDVRKKPRERKLDSQSNTKNIKDGKPNDDGGHYARSEWNGPSEQINYFSQNRQQNQSGDWYIMEKEINSLTETPNSIVKVEMTPKYTGNSKRPYEIEVNVFLNDEDHKRYLIQNP